jgi:hypothetical protein
MPSEEITSRITRVDADETARIVVLRLRPDRPENDDGLDDPTPLPELPPPLAQEQRRRD